MPSLKRAGSGLPIFGVFCFGLIVVAAMIGRGIAQDNSAARIVSVEDSPVAAELLQAASDRLDKKDPEEAARLIQQVLEEHGPGTEHHLIQIEADRYVEAYLAAEQLIRQRPLLAQAYHARCMTARPARHLSEPVTMWTNSRICFADTATEAGLQSALRQAALSLERGRGAYADAILDRVTDHSSRGVFEDRFHELRSIAALILNDLARFNLNRAAVEPATAARLDLLAAALHARDARRVLSPMDPLGDFDATGVVQTALWSVPVEGAEHFLKDHYKIEPSTIIARAEAGAYLNTIPIYADGVLFVNDGMSIWAIEPASGQKLWSTRVLEPPDPSRAVRRLPWLPTGLGLSLTAHEGDRLVGIMGFGAMARVHPYYPAVQNSYLACLDAVDGKVLWSRQPEETDDQLEGAYWYGRPVIRDGRVYATVRKRQRTGFQAAYLFALQLSDGQVLWRRHLASMPVTYRRDPQPGIGHLAVDGGYLYADSRLGTVAKVAMLDGSMQWISRMAPQVEDQSTDDGGVPPWRASVPIRVAAGLIVHDARTRLVRVYDANEGRLIREIRDEDWSEPWYMMRVGEDLMVVGAKRVCRVDGRDLSVIWRSEEYTAPRGRGSWTQKHLYLPVDNGIHVIDLVEGRTLSKLPVEQPSNVLALDGQLVVVHREAIKSYSTWPVAFRQLSERAAQHPKDMRPLMALIKLAYHTDHGEILAQTLDQAVELARQMPDDDPELRRLFEQVHEVARDGSSMPADQRMGVFDRLARIVRGPSQEVAYRLSLARFYESAQRLTEAVEQYQSMLAEPSYRRQLYAHDGGSRQASLEARHRLEALIAKHGRGLYASYEAFAEQRLEELRRGGDTEPLIELAEAYPLSGSAPHALMLAAQRMADQGRLRSGIALLRRAALGIEDPILIGDIYGRQAELYAVAGQPIHARRVLQKLVSKHPGVQPRRGGEPQDPQIWMEQLGERSREAEGAQTLTTPLDQAPPVMLAGRLLTPQFPHASESLPLMLLREADAVRLVRLSDLKVMWRQPIDPSGTAARLLAMDRHRLWLWEPGRARLSVLDTQTGRVLWQDAALREKLGAIELPPDRQQVEAAAPEQGAVPGVQSALRAPFQSPGASERRMQLMLSEGLLMTISDVALAISDREGRMIVLDADSGRVLWQAATTVREASRVQMDQWHVAIAGSDQGGRPQVCIYDAQTGQLLGRRVHDANQDVLWMGLSDEGLLLTVLPGGIEAFDLTRREQVWMTRPGPGVLAAPGAAWLGADRLVVGTRDGDLIWLGLEEGRVQGRLPLRGVVSGPIEMAHQSGLWVLNGEDRLVGLDENGHVLWRDGVRDTLNFADQDFSRRWVWVVGQPSATRLRAEGQAWLFGLDRSGGGIAFQHRLDAEDPPDRVCVMGGRLVISSKIYTAVLGTGPAR